MRDESIARLSTPMFVRCRVHTPADRGPSPAFRAPMAWAQVATAFPLERAATSARSSTPPEPTQSTGRASGDDDAQTIAAADPSSLAVVAADTRRVAPFVDTHVPIATVYDPAFSSQSSSSLIGMIALPHHPEKPAFFGASCAAGLSVTMKTRA
jgi:hypothetical protein